MYSRNVKKIEPNAKLDFSSQSYISYNNGKQQRNNGKFQEYLDESIEKIKNNDDKKSLIDLKRDIISMYTSQTENIEEKVL